MTKPSSQKRAKHTTNQRFISFGDIRAPVSPIFVLAERLPGLRKAIREADVIMLRSGSNPDDQHCVYGRDVLDYIVRNGTSLRLNTCTITIDFDPQYHDLEVMLAMVQVEKGHHEFVPDDVNEDTDDTVMVIN